MAWTYSPTKHRYIADDGRVLTDRELLALRNAVADGMQAESATLAERVVSGAMSLVDWAAGFARLIGGGIRAAFLLGHGGVNTLTPAAETTIAELIATQHDYAAGFARDVAATLSEVASGATDADAATAAVAARSALYAGSAVQSFEVARAASWEFALPYFPCDGGTECQSNCRCAWVDFSEDDENYYATWQTEGDARVCPDCQQRGDESNPFTLPKSDEELGAVAA